MHWPQWEMDEGVIALNNDDEQLARAVINYLGFDERRKIVWGPDYNQVARDLYERACRYLGETPIEVDTSPAR